MAVGVDYSLFYVRRTREERARGASRRDAIDIAAATSGRAVVVSGLAVIVAMAGLLLSGNVVFSSMAVGTMLVVAVAVLGLAHRAARPCCRCSATRSTGPRIPFLHRLQPARRRPVLAGRHAGRAGQAARVAAASPAPRCSRWPHPLSGMRLGESGADSLPRSIPEHAHLRRA